VVPSAQNHPRQQNSRNKPEPRIPSVVFPFLTRLPGQRLELELKPAVHRVSMRLSCCCEKEFSRIVGGRPLSVFINKKDPS
jgi:hypothetical protein